MLESSKKCRGVVQFECTLHVIADNRIQFEDTSTSQQTRPSHSKQRERASMAQSQLDKQLQRPLYGMPPMSRHPIYTRPVH